MPSLPQWATVDSRIHSAQFPFDRRSVYVCLILSGTARRRYTSDLMPIRILCLGDIVGRPGRQVLHQCLPALVRQRQVDLVVANAENIAGGSGITANLFHKIRSYGVDVVTLGDHVYKRIDIVPTLQSSE